MRYLAALFAVWFCVSAPSAQVPSLYKFSGSALGDGLAKSVSGAGDVNGDGFDDVIISTPLGDGRVRDLGTAGVFDSVAPLPRGDSRDYGVGCLTSDGHLPQAEVYDRLVIGHSFDVKLRAGPGFPTSAILLPGDAKQALPLDFLQMPGCTLLLQSPFFIHGTHPVDMVGRAGTILPIPHLPDFIGQSADFHWVIVDGPLAPLANPLGLVTSEAIEITVDAF